MRALYPRRSKHISKQKMHIYIKQGENGKSVERKCGTRPTSQAWTWKNGCNPAEKEK